MKPSRIGMITVAFCAVAAFGAAQNADPNSAGPTKNDFRLRVLDPTEGGTVTGSTVRVVVNTAVLASLNDAKKDTDTMPRPKIEVFLDNESKGTLQDATNVLTIDSVTPGKHMVAALAMNRSGEIIDRKEVHFNVVEATASTATSSSSTASTSTASTAPYTAPSAPAYTKPAEAPAASSSSSSTYSSAPQTTAATTEPARRTATTDRMDTASNSKLPATATADPLLIVGGLGLVLAGYALRRRA